MKSRSSVPAGVARSLRKITLLYADRGVLLIIAIVVMPVVALITLAGLGWI